MNRAWELDLKQIQSSIASFRLHSLKNMEKWKGHGVGRPTEYPVGKRHKKKILAVLDLSVKRTKTSKCCILKPSLYNNLVIKI